LCLCLYLSQLHCVLLRLNNNQGKPGMVWINRCLYLYVCVLSFATVSASNLTAQFTNIKKIESYIQQGHSEEAYQLAYSLLQTYEGIPEFDYVYGLAAQSAQQYHQAIFAFERVIVQYPNSHQARYALAVNYFAIGNLNAAKHEFEQLVSHNKQHYYPRIPEYFKAINKRQQRHQGVVEHSVQLGVGVDSNANSGIEQEFIDIPMLGEVELFASSKAQDDHFIQSQWKSSIIKPLHNKSTAYAVAQLRYADYQENSDMSRLYGDLISGWQTQVSDVQYHLNGFYRPVWLGSDKYLDYYGISGEVSYPLKKNQQLAGSISVANQNYQLDDMDKTQVLGAFWWDTQKGAHRHRWKITAGREDSDSVSFEHLGRNYWGVGYQIFSRINTRSFVDASIDYIDSSYRNVQPLFVEKREDSLWKVVLNYQYRLNKNLIWLTRGMYLDNSSNLTLYEYDRTVVWLALRYQF